jgi:hypothetical protein
MLKRNEEYEHGCIWHRSHKLECPDYESEARLYRADEECEHGGTWH